ncbi:MAG: ATP/GTP-binding protein [Clostridiales bacterium]|nr:ATP/GTP-binding protein [Clostridiales bacterium]
MRYANTDDLKYRVGGLLYTPAMNEGIAEKVMNGEIPCLTSLALCLEDTIPDGALSEAERRLDSTLDALDRADARRLPLLFIRIRTPEHMEHIMRLYARHRDIITGYVLPKYDLLNSERYISLVRRANEAPGAKPVYIMPILESRMIADIATRADTLLKLKRGLDGIRDFVLNIRVGGNDFSNLYGLRRSARQTIYDIGVIRDIFCDIINVFSADYVVSGPVWEYFGERDGVWDAGLMRELELDRINGFIGKTAIHPSQLPIIYESLKARKSDYEDARRILNWDDDVLAVAKSADGTRMNELKCHARWASRVMALAEIYGIRED